MKSILTTKTNCMLGTVSLLALAALTTSFMTTATTPAAFAQPTNLETIKKICGDTAIGFEKGKCKYPIAYYCSFGFESGGFCFDFSTFPPQPLGRAQLVCNQGGEPISIPDDACVGKPTGPTRN